MSDTAGAGLGALIRLCAVAALVMSCIHLRPAVSGAALAVMNGPAIFVVIGAMLLLVVTGLGLSVSALVRPRRRTILPAAICTLPTTLFWPVARMR